MLLNASTIKALSQTVNASFLKAFNKTQAFYPKISMVVQSKTAKNIYPILENFVQMREWIGDRFLQNAKAYTYEITNKHYEATLAISRDDVEDDNVGVYAPLIAEIGRSAAKHPDTLVASLLAGGESATIWDGQNFFDDAHPVGDLTFNNKFALTLTADNYATVRATMMAYKNAKGESLDINPNLLIVPPALEGAAREILKSNRVSGTDNIWQKSADFMVIRELTDTNRWYLLDTTRAVKPFIVQIRKKPEFVKLTKSTDENVFMHNELIYGVDYRGNAGYGLWQLAAMSNPS